MWRVPPAILTIVLLPLMLVFVDGGSKTASALQLGDATWSDPIRVEIRGSSSVGGVPDFGIGGSNPERYRNFRRGPAFSYVMSHLPTSPDSWYEMELSFSEPISNCPGSNRFNLRYAAGEFLPMSTLANALNICESGVSLGAVRALSIRVVGMMLPSREVVIDLAAISGEANLSYIRVGPQGSLDDGSAAELPVAARRNDPAATIGNGVSVGRLTDFSRLAVHEVPLARFGTRALVSPAPQRLAWRQSPLGIGAADLGELIVLVRRGEISRALPFTDRYQLFDRVTQSDRATGVTYVADDPVLALRVAMNISAPFWPQDESATALPAFYAELTVTNSAGFAVNDVEVSVALPVSYDVRDGGSCTQCAPRMLGVNGVTGVAWSSIVATGDSARPLPGEYDRSISVRSDESIVLASSDTAGISIEGAVGVDAKATSEWLGGLPINGAGIPFREPFLFERRIRGHAGFRWTPEALLPGMSTSKGFVIAMHASGKVFRVSPPEFPYQSGEYVFSYLSRYSDITSVAETAMAWRYDQLARAEKFDEIFRGPAYIDLANIGDAAALRNLLAKGLRSYALNAWMLRKIPGSGGGPDQFFNIWEGSNPCCAFNSTVDVVYNDAQMLLALWPSLLDQLLEQWKLFASGSGASTVMPHDIGFRQVADGQFYYAMPVEEGVNYILLSYAHWKATGDVPSALGRLPLAKNLFQYIAASDLDDDFLPDVGTTNTFDASNEMLHTSRNQIYLGFKSAAAAQALVELMSVLGDVDPSIFSMADRLRHGIIHTLENAAWRGDHFAASLDPRVNFESDRNARSINAANGLLYLFQFGGDIPISQSLLEKLRIDATSALVATLGPSGSVQMEKSVTSGWTSQAIWRDAVSIYLGARQPYGSGDFLEFARRYNNQQLAYARQGDGGWWDVYDYAGAPGNWVARPYGKGRGVLGFYPRGAATFGLLQAVSGLTIDQHHKILGLTSPVRANQRIPLLGLADWSTGTIPVADVTGGGVSISSPTARSASLAVTPRAISTPLINVPESIAPSTDPVLVEITASGVAGGASISTGHSGLWYFNTTSASGGSVSSFWNGLVGGVPAYNGAGSACVMGQTPQPTSLRLAGCAPLSVNDNIPQASQRWFLAEGSTAHGFSTYVLIQNPGEVAANVDITYMTATGARPQPLITVPARSRRTLTVGDVLPNEDFSTFVQSDVPVVVERAMYWGGDAGAFREGHAARGVIAPRREWFLPEGSTDHGFAQFVLVQNPSPINPANVNLEFDAEDGRKAAVEIEVPPQSRRTITGANHLPAADFATRVTSTEPVVVERSMYWGGVAGGGGTGSPGLVRAARTWFLAEGSSDHGFSTYTLLQNPSDRVVAVNITYNTSAGPVAMSGITMAPYSRRTITMAHDLGRADSAIVVQASMPILAERAMYWSASGQSDTGPGGWSAGHVADSTAGPSRIWNFAEGSTDHGFVEFVLLQNPTGSDAEVTVRMQVPGGAALPQHVVSVPAGSRRTIRVNDLTPMPTDLALSISSTVPVIAERAMYTGSPGAYVVATASMGVR